MAIKEMEQDIIRPPQPPGLVKWIKENLFSSVFNSILSVLLFPTILYLLYLVINWVLFGANWKAVSQFPLLFAIGQYPRDQIWRVGFVFSGFMFMLGISWGRWSGLLRSIALAAGSFLFCRSVYHGYKPCIDPVHWCKRQFFYHYDHLPV